MHESLNFINQRLFGVRVFVENSVSSVKKLAFLVKHKEVHLRITGRLVAIQLQLVYLLINLELIFTL